MRPRSSASGRGTISHSGWRYTMCFRAAGGSASDTRFTLTHACTFRPARCARSTISSSGSNEAGCFASKRRPRLVAAVVVRVAAPAHLHDERVEPAVLAPCRRRQIAARATRGCRAAPRARGPQAIGRRASTSTTVASATRSTAGTAKRSVLGNVRKMSYELFSAGSRCSSSRSRGSMSSPIASRTESCALRRRAMACV